MGTCSSAQAYRPTWTKTVQFRDEFYKDKISAFSKGFRPINNNTVELRTQDDNTIHSLRWSRGFKTGRHVVEFIYPVHLRATGARVGLGTLATPLCGSANEIIGAGDTYAIDLMKNNTITDNKSIGRLRSKPLPDWFFMYIDLDEGTIQFGSDTEFYGIAFEGVHVPDGGALYPIVTASVKGAIIGIVYRGQGKEVFGPIRKRR